MNGYIPKITVSKEDQHLCLTSLLKDTCQAEPLSDLASPLISISKSSYPFEIDIIRTLYNGGQELQNLRLKQQEIQNELGPSVYKALLDELAEDASGAKLDSLSGEIRALRELKKLGYQDLQKASTKGDWENRSDLISVKTKKSRDNTHLQLADCIIGQMYLENSEMIRQYSDIYIFGMEKPDYDLIKAVCMFIRSDLNSVLGEGIRNYNKTIDDKLEVSLSRLHTGEKILTFQTKDDNGRHAVKLRLKQNFDQTLYSITFDEDTYWIGNTEFVVSDLKSTLDRYVRDFSKAERETQKAFTGWVDIVTHAQNESDVTMPAIENGIAEILNAKARSYPIYVCFSPQHGFDLEKCHIIEYPRIDSVSV